MSLKLEFVEKAMQPGAKLAPLCREYGISRPTGTKWVKRFKAEGYAGLEERSRRPASSPLTSAEELVMVVLEQRDRHPSWGAKKLADLLRKRFGDATPSPSTIARILRQGRDASGQGEEAGRCRWSTRCPACLQKHPTTSGR